MFFKKKIKRYYKNIIRQLKIFSVLTINKIKDIFEIPLNRKEVAMKIIFPRLKSWNLFNGDYLEFGVYRGRAFLGAYKYANKYNFENMRFYAFDSFQGLPEIKGKDANNNHFHKGQYSCSKEDFQKILLNSKVNMKRVEIIPGFFENSLNQNLKKSLQMQISP